MAEITWIEGDTSQRLFVLTQNGVVVDLTGAVVEAVIRPAGGATSAPRVYPAQIVTAEEGKIGLVPPLLFSESPYSARFRVVLAGVTYYFPFPNPDTWAVIR
jgi:hypothetical protein